MFQELLQTWNLGNTTADCLDDLVAEHQDGVDAFGGLYGVKVGAHARYDVGIVGTSSLLVLPVFSLLGFGSFLEVPCLGSKSSSNIRELGEQGDEVGWTRAVEQSPVACSHGTASGTFGIFQGHINFIDLGLGKMIIGFANNGVQEVNGTKGTSYYGIDPLALDVYLGLGSAVREHIVVPKLSESQLTIVAVRPKVL